MPKIFIDANIYLDFYNNNSVKAMLSPLEEIAEHIISTEQVVNEVLRNRVKTAKKLLKEDYQKWALVKPSIPDFLTKEAVAEIFPTISNELNDCEMQFNKLKKLSQEIYSKALEHVALGDDEISKRLKAIFKAPLTPSAEELTKARHRKELGNPPGKHNDPIGDEITWEQLLCYRRENNSELWIVSKDEDFFLDNISGNNLPNSYLLNEVNDEGPTVKFFRNIPAALKEFKASVSPGLALPSEEEMEKAALAQTARDEVKCSHTPVLIQNGRFDMFVCTKCNKTLGAYLADDID